MGPHNECSTFYGCYPKDRTPNHLALKVSGDCIDKSHRNVITSELTTNDSSSINIHGCRKKQCFHSSGKNIIAGSVILTKVSPVSRWNLKSLVFKNQVKIIEATLLFLKHVSVSESNQTLSILSDTHQTIPSDFQTIFFT